MAKNQTPTISTPAAPIDSMKEQLQALRIRKAEVTDEAEYDQLQEEINTVEKAISLAEARRRQAEQEAAEQARRDAIAAHRAGVARLEELKQKRAKLDQAIMNALEEFTQAFMANYQVGADLAELADQLAISAGELELEPVRKEPVTIASMVSSPYTKERAAEIVLAQYMMAWAQIENHKSRGAYAPDKPELSWYAKGNGSFWPAPAAEGKT